MSKKKTLKNVPTYFELLQTVRGEKIPAPKKMLSSKEKQKVSRAARKSAERRERDEW